MKVSFDAPDEWGPLLDEQARKDGHSNRAAVIRKIVNLFFADKSHFVALQDEATVDQNEKSDEK